MGKMNLYSFEIDNPFFECNSDKVCAICTTKLDKSEMHSLDMQLYDVMKVYQVLASVSNFKYLNNCCKFICSTCLHSATAAYKFQQMCNKAQMLMDNFMTNQNYLSAQQVQHLAKNNTEEIEIHVSQSTECCNSNSKKTGKYVKRIREIKKVHCKYCNKLLLSSNLSTHMRIHTDEKPYKCKICPASFKQWTTLKYHTEAHENKRNYVCATCGKTFNTSIYLVIHERTHTMERPHRCVHCKLTFKTKQTLQRHAAVHSTEKPFTCEYCAKSFGRHNTLLLHLKIHTGERPHSCSLCGKAFLFKQGLQKHLKTHAHTEMQFIDGTCPEKVIS